MKFKKFFYKKIKSTNDKAINHIKNGDEKGIILAEIQTKGKGQRGNNWISLKGNLFMTVFFEIKNKINLSVNFVSKQAKEKIEKIGGKLTLIKN